MTKQNEMNVSKVPNIITACCILHNVCEIHGDAFNEEWLEDINTEESDGTQSSATTTSGNSGYASAIRSALVQYFTQNPL